MRRVTPLPPALLPLALFPLALFPLALFPLALFPLALLLASCDPLVVPAADGIERCPPPCPAACAEACFPDGACARQSFTLEEDSRAMGSGESVPWSGATALPPGANVRFSAAADVDVEGRTADATPHALAFEFGRQAKGHSNGGALPWRWTGGGTGSLTEDGRFGFDLGVVRCEANGEPARCYVRRGATLTLEVTDTAAHREAPPCDPAP